MRVDMVPGQSYDLVSSQEMKTHVDTLSARMQEYIRQELVGIKPIRFLAHSNGLATNTGLVLPAQTGPRAGYIWAVQIVTVLTNGNSGLSNMYFGRATNPNDLTTPSTTTACPPENHNFVIAAFSGQTLTFAKGQALLQAGEIPLVFGVNAGASPVSVSLTGTGIEVPAEMIGKLLQ